MSVHPRDKVVAPVRDAPPDAKQRGAMWRCRQVSESAVGNRSQLRCLPAGKEQETLAHFEEPDGSARRCQPSFISSKFPDF
jgi:hypothetical protein